MTDELTPEERDALKNLPRERMPSAGLEDRVVGAMRERGILAATRPGRVVRMTTGRMAGLLAASFALMIGAYSIGLHRGGDNEVIRSVQPVTPPVVDKIQTSEAPGLRADRPATPEVREPEADAKFAKQSSEPTAGLERQDAPATLSVPAAPPEKKEKASEESARLEWSLKDADALQESAPAAQTETASPALQTRGGRSDDGRRRTAEPPAPAARRTLAYKSTVRSAAPSGARERSFRLGDTALFVEAPDSVRIIEDTQGRMLLIYTSDGLIRIRLAD